MPTLPNKPRSGTSLQAANLPDVIGKPIDYCRSITPRPSPTVRVSTTASGTTFYAKPGAGPSSAGGATGGSVGMFRCSAVADHETENGWLISTMPGTAQPLYGQIQHIAPLVDHPVVIPLGSHAYVFATLYIFDMEEEEYVWAWEETLTISTSIPINLWYRKYQSIAMINSSGHVAQGHEGAIVLPTPKSIVDLEAEE